ncbi:MAG: RNA-binding domain-containing protein, partial [Candidatus Zixiibacteriota bacterium]
MKDQNPPQKELLELVKSGREERNLEYKASKDWKDHTTKAKITKTILGMANIRDGGVIVLGVEEIKDQSRFDFNGMLPEHLGAYN